jgi:outer membrane lipoprotein-sorting protein
MRKKVMILMLVVFSLTLVLAACGEKTPEKVLSKLEEKLSAMDGYKAKAEMKMRTGKEDQNYDIEIWHKKKDYYRVALSSVHDEKGSQVILKNDDGVFVLTPSLNKSFKFQTEWPENSSQPYLFQSLVADVQKDKEAKFTVTDSHYIFQTKTNYQSNSNLPFQEIYFDKKNYTPVLVKVLDKDKQALVEVTFSNFELNPGFEENDFKMEESMTSTTNDLPVSGDTDADSFSVLFPINTAGAQLMDKKEIELENGQRVIMTFTGEKNFTLVQEKLESMPTLSYPKEVQGEIVNLGFTIGALSENKIEWNHNGVDFYLASEDLTADELIEVATSVQGKEVK